MRSRAWYFVTEGGLRGEATLIAETPIGAEEAAERIARRMGEYPLSVRAAGETVAVEIGKRHNDGIREGGGHA